MDADRFDEFVAAVEESLAERGLLDLFGDGPVFRPLGDGVVFEAFRRLSGRLDGDEADEALEAMLQVADAMEVVVTVAVPPRASMDPALDVRRHMDGGIGFLVSRPGPPAVPGGAAMMAALLRHGFAAECGGAVLRREPSPAPGRTP